MKTDVVIIGAGPAGLMLGHLLHQAGIGIVILERKSAAHVLSRIRAGVLEQVTVDLIDQLGLGDRMHKEGLPHDGFFLADGARLIHINMTELAGHNVMIYGQTEVTRDLMDACDARGVDVIYEAEDVSLHDVNSDTPSVTYRKNGVEHRLNARFIAGCDGFHGPSRQVIPASVGKAYERVYPFGWLGILADVPPCHEELIYANHANGFALASMRSKTRARYYIQVPLTERVEDWPDDRLWDELALRLGPETAEHMTRGPALEKSIAPLRSFVFEPMRYGSLFLAGDSAHIVPPTGAKGLNLASSDVAYLSKALIQFFKKGLSEGIDTYSQTALARVWKSERFSWTLTTLMHRFPNEGEFGRRVQIAELDYIAGSRAAQTTIAENYIGLPL
ncbi:4-hydroxybenzoate 3-monooxygenase [Henriciella sp.]|uniref:4-hydroxybenzoate 3-monooxygenase n=1 Tax=Henriciella sp. TaxID=1968823 RepID=UPI003C70C63C